MVLRFIVESAEIENGGYYDKDHNHDDVLFLLLKPMERRSEEWMSRLY